jgi:hypothetical protein
MIRAAAAMVLMAAAPVFAQEADREADPEDVAAMIRAIEAAGCLVTVENDDAVMEASRLSPEDVNAVITQLYVSDVLILQEDGTAKLTNEACP